MWEPNRGAEPPATTVARYTGHTCSLCGGATVPGDRIFPFTNSGPISWAHEGCFPRLAGTAFETPPCRHWTRLGKCPMLKAGLCAFAHDPTTQATPEAQTCCGGRRRLVRNDYRAGSFRNWLSGAFGLEWLRSGVVLDVAGGKGELAWELKNCMGVRAVVVDPRPLDLRGVDQRWKKGMFEPKRTGPVFSLWNPAVGSGACLEPPQHPEHLRVFFNAAQTKLMTAAADSCVQSWLDEARATARAVQWTKKGLQEHEDDEAPADGADGADGEEWLEQSDLSSAEEIVEADRVLQVLKQVQTVVGMHPDQAAGEIAQFGVSMGLPWAVVPCCVYAKQFPKRKLADGTAVKTHAQLVQWLMELHPKAQSCTMDFEGKNVCVFVAPEDATLSPEAPLGVLEGSCDLERACALGLSPSAHDAYTVPLCTVDGANCDPSAGFVVKHLLSQKECDGIVAMTLGRFTRPEHAGGRNTNARLQLTDQVLAGRLFARLVPFAPNGVGASPPTAGVSLGAYATPDGTGVPRGCDADLKFERYTAGDAFRPHRDTSRIMHAPAECDGEQMVTLYSVVVYLDNGFQGGNTRFVESRGGGVVAEVVPCAGDALVFRHELLHEGCEVTSGMKHIMRADIFYANVK